MDAPTLMPEPEPQEDTLCTVMRRRAGVGESGCRECWSSERVRNANGTGVLEMLPLKIWASSGKTLSRVILRPIRRASVVAYGRTVSANADPSGGTMTRSMSLPASGFERARSGAIASAGMGLRDRQRRQRHLTGRRDRHPEQDKPACRHAAPVTVTVRDIEESGVIRVSNLDPVEGDTITFTLSDPYGTSTRVRLKLDGP